jgi:hypothetical protein
LLSIKRSEKYVLGVKLFQFKFKEDSEFWEVTNNCWLSQRRSILIAKHSHYLTFPFFPYHSHYIHSHYTGGTLGSDS